MALHKITQNGKLAECRFSLASEVKIVLILSGNLVYPLDMQALVAKHKKELFKRKNAEIVAKSAFGTSNWSRTSGLPLRSGFNTLLINDSKT